MKAIRCRYCGYTLIDFKNRKLNAVIHKTYDLKISEDSFNLELSFEIELICPNCSHKVKLSKVTEFLKKKGKNDLVKFLEEVVN